MQQYEYCEAADNKVTFFGSMPIEHKAASAAHAYYDLGRHGWEMVSASVAIQELAQGISAYGKAIAHYVQFKRPVEDGRDIADATKNWPS
jgi:hypothetical protein